MHSLSTQADSTMQARRSGLVIAAIGLQLLLCSIATAANAAGDSIDRSARRLPTQVAQAFRDIVDRSAATTSIPGALGIPGFRLIECRDTAHSIPTATDTRGVIATGTWARRLLNLPPPTRC